MLKHIYYNWNYFLQEIKTSIRLHLAPNIFSVLSIGLIFFILSFIISGWWLGSNVLNAIQEEAEINAYYNENYNETEVRQLITSIEQISGVKRAVLVNEKQAYKRMVEILGNEAHVLEYFEENPFSAYIEINIDLDRNEEIAEKISHLTGIEYIRDNKEVLTQLQKIINIITLLGYMGITAGGITTLMITAHIIRLGIYSRREQINTLRLLGSPESFIAFPFFLEGIILSLSGGILAAGLITGAINYIYPHISGVLPFIPLMPAGTLIINISLIILGLSTVFGLLGSLIGISSANKI
jgi:cell division transport system permease protein